MSKASWPKLLITLFGWLIALLFFYPIFWMAITAFKTEKGAYSPDLIFAPTLDSFAEVFARSDYLLFARNSILVSFGSTLLCFVLAIPSAYRMAFYPTHKSQSLMLWMLSTKMMPAVGVLIPIYIIWQRLGLLDTIPGINLSSAHAAPLTVFIASYSSPEGLFWAKLSAASFLAVAPIMVLGWLTQKQLVRGLTFGAVK